MVVVSELVEKTTENERTNGPAKVGLSRQAELALSAFSGVKLSGFGSTVSFPYHWWGGEQGTYRNDVVSNLDVGDSLSDGFYNSSSPIDEAELVSARFQIKMPTSY